MQTLSQHAFLRIII